LKRGNVIRAIRRTEHQIDLARSEEKRLAEWRKSLESGLSRFQDYIVRCLEIGGQKKAEADNGSLSIQANPESVEITDLEAIPDEFKTVTVKMPAVTYRVVAEGFLDGCDATFAADKAAINPPEIRREVAAPICATETGFRTLMTGPTAEQPASMSSGSTFAPLPGRTERFRSTPIHSGNSPQESGNLANPHREKIMMFPRSR
jgi:hypothetical protein